MRTILTNMYVNNFAYEQQITGLLEPIIMLHLQLFFNNVSHNLLR